MSWRKIEGTEHLLSDRAVAVLGESIPKVLGFYLAALDRPPTQAEWDALLRTALERVAPGAMPRSPAELVTYDLEKAFESDAEREQLFARGGTLASLLARLGAYRHHPIDETTYHDEKGYGFPTKNQRRGPIPLDPSLRYEELEHLVFCGPRVREVIAKHPATPAAMCAQLHAMGDSRMALKWTQEQLGTRRTAPRSFGGKLLYPALEAALSLCARRGDRREIHGEVATLLRRAGAFDYAYEVEDGFVEEDPWKNGRTTLEPLIVKIAPVPLDPTLPTPELHALDGCGDLAAALIAAHPSKR